MVLESVVNAPSPNASKDSGKKKRANRSAKLKQCKLDARREQWLSLSQVKNKGFHEEVNGAAVGSKLNGNQKKAPLLKDFDLRSTAMEEIHHDSDSDSSQTNSPTSILAGGNNSGNNYSASSSSSTSSSARASCSGNMTEEEEECEEKKESYGGCDDDDGCWDDWEVMADALAATDSNGKQGHNPGADLPLNTETGSGPDSLSGLTGSRNVNSQLQTEILKSEGARVLGKGVVNRRAWRPDDSSRPQDFPNLLKQRSFPTISERHFCQPRNTWIHRNAPTSCPICCEDLDLTDSNFLPCSCGFRLCLFCHKRILEEDGRCPGCRTPYAADPVEKETGVSGGSLMIRLARSSSMSSRV